MDYMLPVPQKGEWRVVLDTDNARFGGFGRQDVSMPHFTDGDWNLSLYLLPRDPGPEEVEFRRHGPPPGAGGLACNSKNGRFIYPFVKGSVVRSCVRNAGWICAFTPGKCPDGRLLPLRGKFPQGGRS